jgi:hypothetical protein
MKIDMFILFHMTFTVRICLAINGKNHNFSQKRTLGFAMLCSCILAINISNENYRKTQNLLTLVKKKVFPVPIIKEHKGEDKYRSTHSERWH